MLRGSASLSLLALALVAPTASASAQIVSSPQNNFHAAVNGMVSLCPALVGGQPIPDEAALIPFGFRPMAGPNGQHRFESRFTDGNVQLWFEPAAHQCTVHYAGPGFAAIVGVARDMAAENHFTRILLDDSRPGVRGEVFERTSGNPAQRERYTIGEFSSEQGASVAYSRRTIP